MDKDWAAPLCMISTDNCSLSERRYASGADVGVWNSLNVMTLMMAITKDAGQALLIPLPYGQQDCSHGRGQSDVVLMMRKLSTCNRKSHDDVIHPQLDAPQAA